MMFNHILRIGVLVSLVGMGLFIWQNSDTVQDTFDISNENLERLKSLTTADFSTPEKAKEHFDHFLQMQEAQNMYYTEIKNINSAAAQFLFSLALIQMAYLMGVYTTKKKRITSGSTRTP